MQQNEMKIQQDLDRLITVLNKDANEQLREDINNFSRKVLSSQMGRPTTETGVELKEKIVTKVANVFDQRSVLHCQEAVQRFLNSPCINRKPQVLKMLLKLSEMSEPIQNLSNIFKQSKKVNAVNYTQDTINSSVIPNQSQQVQSPHQLLPQRRKVLPPEQLSLLRYRGNVERSISETDILRQVSYVMQNITSTMIVEDNEEFSLKSGVNVSEAVRNIVADISELGWLFRNIVANLQETGNIVKALNAAVHEQVNQYYMWLATMENMMKSNDLTLRKLVMWSYEPFELLKWLCIVLEAVKKFHGCQIISIVNSFRPQGNPAINDMLNRLLGHLLQPLFHYIYHWAYKGELIDSKNEFFIRENKKVDKSDQWSYKFTMVTENVPAVITEETAQMIFSIGKTIYFLRNHCRYNYILDVPFINTKQILETKTYDSKSILSAEFKTWLNTVYELTNKELVMVLFNQFNLRLHFESMKYFFLHGKGDFIQHIFDNLKDELNKQKHEIYEHNLDGYITDGINKCFIDYQIERVESKARVETYSSNKFTYSYRENVVARLLAKKVDYGSEGWDVFNLQYSIERIEPIQTILSPEATRNYQKIFNFLWKVKRIEQSLKDIWIIYCKDYSRETPKRRSNDEMEFAIVFRDCHILRAKMSHFLTNFYSYIMITIESAWKKFNEALDSIANFDQILKLHQSFQQEVLQITFCSVKFKVLTTILDQLFAAISKFRINAINLQNEFSDYYERCRKYENKRKILQTGIDIDMDMEVPTFNQSNLIKEVGLIKETYNVAFKKFYQLIEQDSESRLAVLAFRLDFSEFYTHTYDHLKLY